MAVQSSFYLGTALDSRTFPSTKHIATKQHMAVWRQQVSDDVWVQMDISDYQLINNSCVLNQLLSQTLYKQLEVRIADAPDELATSPSDIAIVAAIATEVEIVAEIADEVVEVATGNYIKWVVDTIEDLASINTDIQTQVSVSDIDRGDPFEYNPALSATNNGVTIFDGWVRQYSGAINIKWSGAKGDGTTDDTTAINNAMLAGNTISFIGDETYLISQITFPATSNIITNGCEFIATNTTSDSANITSGANSTIDMINVTVPTSIRRDRAVNINTDNVTVGAINVTSVDQQLTADSLDGAVQVRGNNITIGRISAINYDKAVVVYTASNVNIEAVEIESYLRGIFVSGSDVITINSANIHTLSPTWAATEAGYNGLLSSDSSNVTYSNFRIEDAGEHGVRCGGDADTYYIEMNNFTVINPAKCGIKLRCSSAAKIRHVNINNPTLIDCGSGTIDVNEDGLLIERTQYVTINNPVVDTDLQSVSCNDGINIYQCNGITINGGYIFDCKRSGVYGKPDSVDDALDPETSDLDNITIRDLRIDTTVASGVTIDYTAVNARHINMEALITGSGAYGIEFIDGGSGILAQPCHIDCVITNPTTAEIGGTGYKTGAIGTNLGDSELSGFVGSDGSTDNDIPDGFTVTYIGTGVYDVNHNFNISEKKVIPSFVAYNVNVYPTVLSASTTNATRVSWKNKDGTNIDTDFFFKLTVLNRSR